MKMKQYAFWVEEDCDNSGYWNLFDSLEDAVSEESDNDIYELNATFLGKYKIKTVLVKEKLKKK